jgi:hypothetical protein
VVSVNITNENHVVLIAMVEVFANTKKLRVDVSTVKVVKYVNTTNGKTIVFFVMVVLYANIKREEIVVLTVMEVVFVNTRKIGIIV